MSDLMFSDRGGDVRFLTDEQIQEVCPVAFSTTASSEVSKHYTHIPTNRVIDDMRKLGWDVTDAKQVAARKESTGGFQKHMLVFRNPDLMVKGKDGDDVWPQIIMTNSHDGKNSFSFQAGLFRMICENGLVIATTQFEAMKIRHMGYDFETLQNVIKNMISNLDLTVESMNKMKEIELTKDQTKALAKKALSTRFTEEQVEAFKIDIDQLLEPTRPEDKGSDLWSVFNVIQEKILDGDFTYVTGAKSRKARKVKNFKQDMEINQKLFAMAAEYTTAVAA
jgi:hypothetical protein